MTESKIIQGDCLSVLKTMESSTVNCCVTSPPYYGLRDYGMADQIGLETSPIEYVEKLVQVFREVWRVLRDDGVVWLNLGDSYNGSGGAGGDYNAGGLREGQPRYPGHRVDGLKPKDMIGIPWRVAFALQSDGWYLRQDIIWAKPNPMPESVSDRCTKSHEYIFLLSKSQQYYFDSESIKEIADYDGRKDTLSKGSKKYNNHVVPGQPTQTFAMQKHERWNKNEEGEYIRNKRDVWKVPTECCKEAHFATFPKDLIRPCIKAGCPVDGIVIDPFLGSGTTACVCIEENRKYLGIELNPEYIKIAQKRINSTERNGLIIFKEESE